MWAWLRGSPWERVRELFRRGEIDEAEAERRFKILRWLLAIFFPAGLFAAICALRWLIYRRFYTLHDLGALGVLLAPLGPLFAWAVDRFVERPALRRLLRRTD
ncbi:MAG TPA: hypothetical protein VF950_12925 [Planctomycetota bacterium]